jgi:hypothetical protein
MFGTPQRTNYTKHITSATTGHKRKAKSKILVTQYLGDPFLFIQEITEALVNHYPPAVSASFVVLKVVCPECDMTQSKLDWPLKILETYIPIKFSIFQLLEKLSTVNYAPIPQTWRKGKPDMPSRSCHIVWLVIYYQTYWIYSGLVFYLCYFEISRVSQVSCSDGSIDREAEPIQSRTQAGSDHISQ